MGTMVPNPLNERQARELARVPQSERNAVLETAQASTGGKVTAAAIKAAVRESKRRASPTPPAARAPTEAEQARKNFDTFQAQTRKPLFPAGGTLEAGAPSEDETPEVETCDGCGQPMGECACETQSEPEPPMEVESQDAREDVNPAVLVQLELLVRQAANFAIQHKVQFAYFEQTQKIALVVERSINR